ncbi:MAG: thioredoxin family protein [Fibrobacterota bacterium]
MKKIQILGSGCAKCKKLAETADAAAKLTGIPYTLEKVTDMTEILNFGVMMTPALVVDGTVKVSGRVPDIEEIKKFILN